MILSDRKLSVFQNSEEMPEKEKAGCYPKRLYNHKRDQAQITNLFIIIRYRLL